MFDSVADAPKSKLPPAEYVVVGGEAPDVKKASFRLCSDELDPETITHATGLVPDRAHRKGEPRESKTGRHPIWRSGLWLIDSSTALSTSAAPLEEHVKWLLDRLEPSGDQLRVVCREQGLVGDFYCGYFMHQWNSSIGLDPQTLGRIAALNAGVVIDIYGPDPEDPERIVVVPDEDGAPQD